MTNTKILVRDVDRIDFLRQPDGRVIVQAFRRDATTQPARPRDIPIHTVPKPEDFDFDSATAWCERHGFAVRQWREDAGPAARAWKGEKPWVIRTRGQIIRLRRRLEREAMAGRSGKRSSKLGLDLAYDG